MFQNKIMIFNFSPSNFLNHCPARQCQESADRSIRVGPKFCTWSDPLTRPDDVFLELTGSGPWISAMYALTMSAIKIIQY